LVDGRRSQTHRAHNLCFLTMDTGVQLLYSDKFVDITASSITIK
jgi:hypothetical protein